jgi:hypothetical protein
MLDEAIEYLKSLQLQLQVSSLASFLASSFAPKPSLKIERDIDRRVTFALSRCR